MDIINVVDENGNLMVPHPDYFDYYTILLLKDGKYINVFDKDKQYKDASEVVNIEEYYDDDLIMEIHSLLDYLIIMNNGDKISERECELYTEAIENTKKLKLQYGYKKQV